ncbi:putative ob-fold nucleic acid binding domain-containing protein [Rosellinia necatrix]|uniref:CST complex subunit STN1 n=1 Tax=Rosellinia necatrix TaxID=77044 RepID=A0A1W2TG92_ROSNE|nr:putative ob-fold nucleic acid binding domain-containing protein [Rosellinia necatrix]
MTTADTLVYYPQYCFHLSPTINKWCPLQAADIVGLLCRPGFEDIDVFFYLNHPIRWVRITGVVVAIDDYRGHRVYTVDDSTGQCIECAVSSPKPASDKTTYSGSGDLKRADPQPAATRNATVAHAAETAASGAVAGAGTTTTTPPLTDTDIDVGTVLDVKGRVTLFRGQKQIKIQKATPVFSTNQEVLFWDKIRDFRREALSEPWALTDREVRRCRKMHQAEAAGPEEGRRKKRARAQAVGLGAARGSDTERARRSEGRPRSRRSPGSGSIKAARAQRTVITGGLKSAVGDGHKYDALGL